MSNTTVQIGYKAGEMGKHIQNNNWADTPLNSIDEWPQSLRSFLNICLSSDSPAGICWGDNLLFIYNDAWKNIIGEKHPSLLGKPVREVFKKDWTEVGSKFKEVLSTGKMIETNNMSFPGDKGDHKFNFSLNPISDTESVRGIFITATANTATWNKEDEQNLQATEQQENKIKIDDSEEKYQTLFETMNEGFCILKILFDEDDNPVDYHYLEVNSSFKKHTGLEDVEGKRAYEVFSDVGDFWLETYGNVALTGEPVNFERKFNELQRWFEVSAFRIGKPRERKVAVLFNNITGRKENELSNAYLGAIVENSDDAIIGKDLEGNIISWNESAEQMFGYTAEEAIGEPISIIIPDNRIEEEENILERIKQGDRIEHYETMRKHKEGMLLDISLTISPVRNSKGEIIGLSKIARDISDRKQMREERERLFMKIENEKERLSEIFQQAPSFMCILRGPDHIFERANDYYRKLVGNRKLIGRPVREAIPEASGQGFFELLDEVYKTGESFVGKDMEVMLHRNPDADQPTEKRYLDFVYQPLRDPDGSITGIFVQGIDLTERHHAKKELKEINETLEERVKERTKKLRSYQKKLQSLASKLNKAEQRERERLASELHDKLSQLLTVAKIKAGSLLYNEFSDEVSTEIQELKEMVDEALSYSQNLMAELKPPAALDEEDVTEVLYETAEKMQDQGLNVVIKDDGQPKIAEREVRTMLHQSVRELLLNVTKHTDVKEARMVLSRTDNQIKITIADEGQGFEMEDDEPNPTDEGGFGLFNIQERVNWHGGTFEVRSEPGKGTTATLYAPLKEKQEEPVEQEIPPLSKEELEQDLEQKIKVLLVDDHDMMRRGLRQMIEREGDLTIIAEAADGREALEQARQKTPDVIVMDVNMPVLDGIEATQKIKSEMPGVRIIGLSLHDSRGVINEMRNAGASAYLTKNEAFETLCATIRDEMTSVKK